MWEGEKAGSVVAFDFEGCLSLTGWGTILKWKRKKSQSLLEERVLGSSHWRAFQWVSELRGPLCLSWQMSVSPELLALGWGEETDTGIG